MKYQRVSVAYFGIRRVSCVRPKGSIADAGTKTGEHTWLFGARGLIYFGLSPASGRKRAIPA